MYKKYLEHVVLATVRYFLNYDHDVKSQLLVIASFITLFAKMLLEDGFNFFKSVQHKTAGWMQVIRNVKSEKSENLNQEVNSVRNYIKKDILRWQLNNG